MSDPVDRDRLAADWIGYALAWGRRQRPRHWDWEQAAIDGLARALTRYDGSSAFGQWLDWHLRAAARELRRYHQVAGRDRVGPLAEGSDDELPALGAEPIGLALERSDACSAALRQLSTTDRLIVCGLADGLRQAEIAARLGVSQQAVSKRFRVIQRTLKED